MPRPNKKELKLTINKLPISLRLTKVILCGHPGEEAILFGYQIDQYVEVLEENMN